jgi:maltoporin
LRDADTKIKKLEEQVKAFEFHDTCVQGTASTVAEAGRWPSKLLVPGQNSAGQRSRTYGELIFVNNLVNPIMTLTSVVQNGRLIQANTTNPPVMPISPVESAMISSVREAFCKQETSSRATRTPSSGRAIGFTAAITSTSMISTYRYEYTARGGRLQCEIREALGSFSGGRSAGYRQDVGAAKSNFDIRLLRHEGTGRTSLCLVNYAMQRRHSTNGDVIPTTDGWGLGFRHSRTEFHGGFNEFALGYAKGAASNLGTSLDDPTRFLKHTERLLITENFLIQPNSKFAIMPLFIYQRTRNAMSQDGPSQWYSFGARPQFFFTNHVFAGIGARLRSRDLR